VHVKELVSHYKDARHHSISPDREERCSSTTWILPRSSNPDSELMKCGIRLNQQSTTFSCRDTLSYFSLAADTNTAIYKKGMNQAVASLLNEHTHTHTHTQTSGKGENHRQMLLNSFGENI